jgi:hypothetical protein
MVPRMVVYKQSIYTYSIWALELGVSKPVFCVVGYDILTASSLK